MTGTGNAISDALMGFNPSGHVTPYAWYKTIVKDTGKPYLYAIIILSDLADRYRKKLDSDLVQCSYAQFAERFNISKRDAQRAIVFLEELGVVKRHFRTVAVEGAGASLSNVLFLELVPDRLIELSR